MLIIIWITYFFLSTFSLAINFTQRDIIKDLRKELDLKNNSLKKWLDEEVNMKRTYSKLSDALIFDRDDYRNRYLSLHKKYNRLNRYIKSFIKWRITLDILISKIR